ncbi:riboflavin kinase/FMN adenylyltransferase [Bathymodiolus platifrons methanotrophic gill symbiont]|uniref:bifunctional riboflavin kinase/FAD synthetase n=1 Tax=Bathymodiolus platifrons methanotrophic gill symbiont TaxID=113268 RepID=UPI0011CB694A|nr:bifunctional riboflavin kinase/FAD synthetase [Bathymodiolus platifrons methanotrophic gill symbiont]TXK97035.1 riboflavin biosynthesis protein RibF [Methylococcaceae bacterium HT1]TXL16547.1 riboflavin biosynthesis protein RibF [Methylococcaceae bacterium HT3]TXL22402.1 riboflavin biosynthesis protein RibF [Methylococcaceae bacterium HT2]GFO76460.1 riboflavin kinase/FMN adenylyltransferase [Bathymodiolus platifrons methanotrophic gill symbiont]
MQLIRGIKKLQSFDSGCVLTIGNFDGVHKGHSVVINKLAEKGKLLGLPVVVMVFEPQPLEFFLKDNAPSRLTRLREKIIHFKHLPVDNLLIVSFNQCFANLDPKYFIQEILVERLNVKYLVVGDDFHFGKARRGNFALLQEAGEQYSFKVIDTASYSVKGSRVSSTLIRDALNNGDLATAESMLGRSYSVCGRVVHGEKLGRKIGFPTANIQMQRKNTPIQGVFAVTMTGIGEKPIFGVANVGTKPTVDSRAQVLLETHLFDFDQDIYGKYVEVHFKYKIRSEMRFQSVDDLKRQIQLDTAQARTLMQQSKK